jgi:hypothetical protein
MKIAIISSQLRHPHEPPMTANTGTRTRYGLDHCLMKHSVGHAQILLDLPTRWPAASINLFLPRDRHK